MSLVTEVDDSKAFNSLADHITQSWEWGQFRSQTPSIKKVLRLGSFREGKLKRVWQIFFSRVPGGLPYTIGYLPRGEMPNNSELEEIKKYCLKEKALFLKIEPLSPPTSYKLSAKSSHEGKAILPQHTIYIDLTLSEEKLLAQMHEKTRYNIHLAQKKGVVIKEEDSPEALENFIKLLITTEHRQGFLAHYPDYYRHLWKALRPAKMVYLLSAYLPDSSYKLPVASIMLFHFKDFLYYPYGGSNPEFRSYMAPNLLRFEAMKLGKKLKCQT